MDRVSTRYFCWCKKTTNCFLFFRFFFCIFIWCNITWIYIQCRKYWRKLAKVGTKSHLPPPTFHLPPWVPWRKIKSRRLQWLYPEKKRSGRLQFEISMSRETQERIRILGFDSTTIASYPTKRKIDIIYAEGFAEKLGGNSQLARYWR